MAVVALIVSILALLVSGGVLLTNRRGLTQAHWHVAIGNINWRDLSHPTVAVANRGRTPARIYTLTLFARWSRESDDYAFWNTDPRNPILLEPGSGAVIDMVPITRVPPDGVKAWTRATVSLADGTEVSRRQPRRTLPEPPLQFGDPLPGSPPVPWLDDDST